MGHTLGLLATAPRFLSFTGKGGVGKTALSCAAAIALADAGKRVLLVSTDPASNLDEMLATRLDDTPRAVAGVARLDALNIDPEAAAEAYVAKAVAARGAGLDEEGKRLLIEDLRSPGTDEVAVFHAFARIVAEARASFVVLDTAPTGHTLLLMDATGAYHRQFARVAALAARYAVVGWAPRAPVGASALRVLLDADSPALPERM